MSELIMLANAAFNRLLDKLPRARLQIGKKAVSSFQVCGSAGFVLAVALALTLTIHLGLSAMVMAAIILSAILTFFAVILGTMIITGEGRMINYHHVIAVIIVAAVELWLLGQPVLI